jgi:hypothetical protein
MPGSGAGGGGREEPWRVVTLARRCLVALVRRSRAEEVQHGGGGAQRRRRSRLRQSPAPNQAHRSDDRSADSPHAPRRPLASSSAVFHLGARVKPPVDP